MPNDRDPEPHMCTVQSDRLIFKDAMSAWLQFVYVNKRTFSSNILLLEVFFSTGIFHSPFYQQGSRRCADGAERKLNEIEAGQSTPR